MKENKSDYLPMATNKLYADKKDIAVIQRDYRLL